MKLSIITTGRNDNHHNHWCERLNYTFQKNLEVLKFLNCDYEIILVDWCSDVCMYEDANFNISDKKIKNIIVDKDIVSKKFRTDVFYQFFAKNVGIRYSDGEYILLMNVDNFFTESLMKKINEIIDNDDKKTYYRTKYWYNIDVKINKILEVVQSDKDKIWPEVLGVYYSGDFLLSHRSVIINYGEGYDETNTNHQTNRPQIHMDSEILINMNKKGIKTFFIDDIIYHHQHTSNPVLYDNEYNKNGYNNSEHWGFSDKKLIQLKENVFKIINE